jgi:hypothetical protein
LLELCCSRASGSRRVKGPHEISPTLPIPPPRLQRPLVREAERRIARPPRPMPEANAPDPATTGQAPTISEKMQPEMDSVGGPKSRAGEEKK